MIVGVHFWTTLVVWWKGGGSLPGKERLKSTTTRHGLSYCVLVSTAEGY